MSGEQHWEGYRARGVVETVFTSNFGVGDWFRIGDGAQNVIGACRTCGWAITKAVAVVATADAALFHIATRRSAACECP